MQFARQVATIMAKDLRAELRTKEAINASLSFALVVLLLFSFAFELGNDCLDALIAAPIPGSALFLGKAFANFVLVLAVELIALPLFGIFYNVHWTAQFWQLMLVIVLGTWAMTVTGTIFSALTVNIRL